MSRHVHYVHTVSDPSAEPVEQARIPFIDVPREVWEQVQSEVRANIAAGARTPMTAAHLDALGLRDAITDLMLGRP